jgi:hypothetical protein
MPAVARRRAMVICMFVFGRPLWKVGKKKAQMEKADGQILYPM